MAFIIAAYAPSVMDLSRLGFEPFGKWRKGFANGKGREAD
jgi:hypothetical protein